MRILLFFLRVSAICNLCFLIGCLLRIIHYAAWMEIIVKTILVLGFIVAMPLNMLVSLVVIILLLLNKIMRHDLPKIIVAFNLLVLLIELWYFYL